MDRQIKDGLTTECRGEEERGGERGMGDIDSLGQRKKERKGKDGVMHRYATDYKVQAQRCAPVWR